VVPDVVGWNFLEALVAVDPPFHLLDVRYRSSSDVPNGTILAQRPPAGTSVSPSEPEITIRVVVSRSPG
jgi:beta-lactam-binding protein with PASTA domain